MLRIVSNVGKTYVHVDHKAGCTKSILQCIKD